MRNLEKYDVVWAVRRLPKSVVDLMKAHSQLVVAGGFIRSMVCGEKANDIDLFGPSEDFVAARSLDLSGTVFKVHKTGNAYTIGMKPVAVQLIHRWTYDSPEKLIESFDFTIASAAIWWTGKAWTGICHDTFYSDLAGRRLVYLSPDRNEDAGGSMLRVLKFYQRGFRIPIDSLSAVIARLMKPVEFHKICDEVQLSKVLSGLLREVDPNVDPDHISHLPSINGEE